MVRYSAGWALKGNHPRMTTESLEIDASTTAPRTEAELIACLRDPHWRLRNLYKIKDKNKRIVPFRPNAVQDRLLREMHYRNIIPKARQRGFCLDPETLVLTADLRWVRIAEVRQGDELVGVDEFSPGGRGPSRKMRSAVVVASAVSRGMAYRVTFDCGRAVICTGNHRWLSRPSESVACTSWRSIEHHNKKKLRVGSLVRWVTSSTWEGGSLEFWEGRCLPGKRVGAGWSRIVSIEPLGERDMIDLQTTTGTFIAEGFVSHNSTLIQLMALDTALFVPDTDAGVIAQDLETAQDIFQSKIKLAYDHLPPVIQQMVPVTSSTTTSITFANGSKVRVGTSMRGGTPSFVHVSEFGKICAKYPDKAREVLTGTLPAAPKHGIVFIESTAEGRDGAFYEMCQEAKAAQDEGRKLSPLDFKLHFAGWWDADEYELDPAGVVITDKDHEYFDAVEAKIGHPIGQRKRAWYVTQRRQTFAGDQQMMFQEFPSTFEEAFSVSLEGTYYAAQLAQARKEGRITRLPVLPDAPCYTAWDIGNSDGTAIWVVQRVGHEWRCIHFYEAWGEPYSHAVRWLQSLGLVWDRMYLPHDADHVRQGEVINKSPRQMLEALMPGVRFEVVPRIEDVNWGIQQTRDFFPLLWFDEERCKDGLIHIEAYRRKWNDRQACWSSEPDKTGGHSEAADALRQLAQAYAGGLININRGPTKRPKPRSWRVV